MDGIEVPFLAVFRHQQLYDPGFPARWRAHVLARIAATAPRRRAGYSAAQLALNVARQNGLDVRVLTQTQIRYWLTGEELATLGGAEQMSRILVRAASVDRAAPGIWPSCQAEAQGLLNPSVASLEAAAAAFRRNHEVAAAAPGQTVHHLRPARLLTALAAEWHLDHADGESMTAEARDRGFADAGAAVEASRAYFLSRLA